MFQKFCKILAALISVSPVTDATAWGVAGERAGSTRQRQNQGKITYFKKKKVLGPHKPLTLHELIVRIDDF